MTLAPHGAEQERPAVLDRPPLPGEPLSPAGPPAGDPVLVEVRAQVAACFQAYEAALVAGDVTAMNGWFDDSERTIRFGIAEEHWGASAINAWRSGADPVPAGRELSATGITVCSPEVAVVSTLFRYPGSAQTGRQSQTWVRTGAGWRIVHAHVSYRGADGS